VYTVTTDEQAKPQVDALPRPSALTPELSVVLETAPWSGRPYHRDNPEGPLRVPAVRYIWPSSCNLVLEDQRRVDVVMGSVGRLTCIAATWLGRSTQDDGMAARSRQQW